jgi:flagellar motor switch protein FliG
MGEFYMGNGKSTVITVYGHNKTIDKIAVSLFDKSESGHYGYDTDSNAETYCNTINGLKLEGESWILAKLVSENTQYELDAFLPAKFALIAELDDRAIQKILRETDSQDIAKALKGENEAVQEKIFNNMSKRAAEMLKEDMEYMGPVRITDVKDAQEKILGIIQHLEQTGEIVIQCSQGRMIE